MCVIRLRHVVLCTLLFLALGANRSHQDTGQVAREIHFNSLVVDTHCDTLTKILDGGWSRGIIDIGNRTSFDVDIPKLRQGGIDVQFFAVFAPERFYPGEALSRSLALLNALHSTVEKNPGEIALAESPAHLKDLVEQGKIAAIASLEGADLIREPYGIELLGQLSDAGVRSVSLTWNYSNDLAEGVVRRYSDGSPSTGGLPITGGK